MKRPPRSACRARARSRRIVLPQAMRSILPTAFNDIIGLAKGTSIVYILAMPELFYTVQIIYHRNLEVIPLLMVATVWYLIILTVLSAIQLHIERYYARGATREQVAVSPLSALFGRWRSARAARSETSAQSDRRHRAQTTVEATARGWAQRRVGGRVGIQDVSKSFGDAQGARQRRLSFRPGSVP